MVKLDRSNTADRTTYGHVVRNPEATRRVMALVLRQLNLDERPGAPAHLAKLIGMPPYSEGSISLVRRWIRGAHGPSFDYTMEMLSAAGLLTPEADRAWKGVEADPAAEARAAGELAEQASVSAGRAARIAQSREKRETAG